MSIRFVASALLALLVAFVAAGPAFATAAVAGPEGDAPGDASADGDARRAAAGIDVAGFTVIGVDAVPPPVRDEVARLVSLGLPDALLDFFRTVPLRIDPLLPVPGRYRRAPAGWLLELRPDQLSADKPVLLHELLHAYHRSVLGLQNAEVSAAWRRALANWHAHRAYFLQDDKEFFAVTASIYLSGTIRQRPFGCRIFDEDPEYLALLRSLFGAGHC